VEWHSAFTESSPANTDDTFQEGRAIKRQATPGRSATNAHTKEEAGAAELKHKCCMVHGQHRRVAGSATPKKQRTSSITCRKNMAITRRQSTQGTAGQTKCSAPYAAQKSEIQKVRRSTSTAQFRAGSAVRDSKSPIAWNKIK